MDGPEVGALDPARIGPLAVAVVDAARAAHIAVVVTDVHGSEPKNLFVSDALCDMTGYSQAELVERGPLDNVAPEDLPRLRARFEQRSAGEAGTTTYEVSMVRKDGTRVPIEATTTSVDISGRRSTISFIVDLSDRKRTEAALRSTETNLRKLIEVAPEAIGILRDGHFVYVNSAYVEMLGYESAEQLMQVSLYDLVQAEDRATLRGREALHMKGERLPPVVYRGIRRDRSMLLIEVSAAAFEFEGQPAILSIGRDVTERKRMEAQLVQADRLAALGTLAAGVAHEVNNPLAYLLLNLEWLARQLPELAKDPSRLPELSAMMEEARHGAERVGAIVRELRAFSRADGETKRLVDLAAAANSAIKIAAHEIKHRARVTTTFEEAPSIWANESRIEQVLLNLLLNAAQAMPERGAETNEIRVSVRAGAGERAIVAVSDNGVGIPPETVRRIFDPFFTTKPVGVGTGLGLSICHSIVASLGGEITVQSTVGEGTTFRMELPSRRFDSEPRSGQEPTSAEVLSRKRGKVLVVDDELAIANTMRDLLQTEHDVTAVASGSAALAVIEAGTEFDIVFCDLMMPHVSGMDLYEALRAKNPGFEEKVVFMTGGAFTAHAAEFLARVPNRRVEKPFALSTIEQLVRDAVNANARKAPGASSGRVA
jgi:two-component system cell cycle sensor histidine kinase/response regulator CckA